MSAIRYDAVSIASRIKGRGVLVGNFEQHPQLSDTKLLFLWACLETCFILKVVCGVISSAESESEEPERFYFFRSCLRLRRYATTMSWIRARVSFAFLWSALACLRGSRAKRRINLELPDVDFEIEKGHANIRQKDGGGYFISYFLSFFLADFHIRS